MAVESRSLQPGAGEEVETSSQAEARVADTAPVARGPAPDRPGHPDDQLHSLCR